MIGVAVVTRYRVKPCPFAPPAVSCPLFLLPLSSTYFARRSLSPLPVKWTVRERNMPCSIFDDTWRSEADNNFVQ